MTVMVVMLVLNLAPPSPLWHVEHYEPGPPPPFEVLSYRNMLTEAWPV